MQKQEVVISNKPSRAENPQLLRFFSAAAALRKENHRYSAGPGTFLLGTYGAGTLALDPSVCPSWSPVFWSVIAVMSLQCSSLIVRRIVRLTCLLLESSEECLRAVASLQLQELAAATLPAFVGPPGAFLEALLQSPFQTGPASNYHPWALCNTRVFTKLPTMALCSYLWGFWGMTHFFDKIVSPPHNTWCLTGLSLILIIFKSFSSICS